MSSVKSEHPRFKIAQLIDNQIIGAQDNALRARMQFGRMTPVQLDEEYGESGRKCKEILAEHENTVNDAVAMKEWFLSLVEQRSAHPIIGQEAICPDGLGRVVGFNDDFPHQWIKVSTYVNDRGCQWAPHNVELIDPRK